ncbi:MAG: 50S ribosomal protein L21 [Acidimicrobiales bacterium]
MYAIVATGGKQYRVEEGQTLRVERLGDTGSDVELQPVMVVDGDQVLATRSELAGTSVSARVIDEVKGQKIDGFTYKPKSNNRRRYGHRQTYATIEITGISKG